MPTIKVAGTKQTAAFTNLRRTLDTILLQFDNLFTYPENVVVAAAGGCLRDSILGNNPPKDIDLIIANNTLSAQEIFNRVMSIDTMSGIHNIELQGYFTSYSNIRVAERGLGAVVKFKMGDVDIDVLIYEQGNGTQSISNLVKEFDMNVNQVAYYHNYLDEDMPAMLHTSIDFGAAKVTKELRIINREQPEGFTEREIERFKRISKKLPDFDAPQAMEMLESMGNDRDGYSKAFDEFDKALYAPRDDVISTTSNDLQQYMSSTLSPSILPTQSLREMALERGTHNRG